MKISRKNFFKIFLIAAVIAVIFASLPTTQKLLYPFYYRDKVEEHSARYRVDKFLAVSVMKVESNFSEGAISRSGAVGLMQIMPETANWIADCLDEEPPTINKLHDSDTNIFFGNDVLALAAYNAGRGNVRHWMEQGDWQKNFSDVDAIPYLETRQYVRKVLACREKYIELYGAKNEPQLFVSR